MRRDEGSWLRVYGLAVGAWGYGFRIQRLRSEGIWEFPKIRGTLFWGRFNKDPTIWGTI